MSLTTSQLQYAEQRNPYWRAQLGAAWAGNKLSLHELNSPQFAYDVYTFQRARGLTADGICGPNTNTSVTKTGYLSTAALESDDAILIGNWRVPCNFYVISPGETGAMVFTRSFYDTPILRPKLLALHWDVATSSKSCYSTLIKRGLSVQFMCDSNAIIYQSFDPAFGACWHSGQINLISWGIEINNPVELAYQNPINPRPVIELGTRGSTQKILGFYPEQIAAIVKWCHWCCEYAGIPKQLPSYKGSVGVYNSYIRGPGDEWKVNGFTGVVGHLHQDNVKIDPGMSLWQPLIDSGFKVVSAG